MLVCWLVPLPLCAPPGRVKALLDNCRNKKPNERFLLREDNFSHMVSVCAVCLYLILYAKQVLFFSLCRGVAKGRSRISVGILIFPPT